MYEALLKNTPEYQKIAASLASPGPAALFGLPPTGRALLYAALQKDTGRILCVVTPGEAEATHFADDLKTLGLSAAVFPPRDFMLRPVEGAGREYEYRRLSVLGALAGGRLNAVCVPAEALLQYTVPQDEFQKNTLTLKPGMVYNREALVERLFAAGYVRRSQVDGPGQFSVRGDIVDIYAPDMRQPARVEYWDDEIDSLASFDLLTQRRDGALKKSIFPPPVRCCSAAPPTRRRPSAPPRRKPAASAAPPSKRPWSPTSPSWTAASCPRLWTNTTVCGTRRPPHCSTT